MGSNEVKILWFLSIATNTIVIVSSCVSVRNVPLTYQYEDSNGATIDKEMVLFSNCVEDSLFEPHKPVYITIRCSDGELPLLEKSSVRNMSDVRGLVLDNCKTETIEPGAFYNVPKLMNIDIINGTVKEIHRGIFDGMRLISLHLDWNEIYIIDDYAFSNMPTLSIFLNHNQLTYYKREWFTNTTDLQALGLSHNFIRRLPPRAFQGFRNLIWLDLSHNELSVIYPDAFEGITKFDSLELNNNRLATLSSEVFPTKLRIQFLNLGSNLFNFLPNQLLKKMTVDKIHIGSNPFLCPCLDSIYYWFYYAGVNVASQKECSRADIPVCAFSKSQKSCNEVVNQEVTSRFLSHLKSLRNPVPLNCANYQENADFGWLRQE